MPDKQEQSTPPQEAIIDGLSRIKHGLFRLQTKLQNKWKNSSIWTKLVLWAPFQGILFKVQPQLWDGIAFTLNGFVNISSILLGGVITLNLESQLILIIFATIVVQTTIIAIRLINIETDIERIDGRIEEVHWLVEDIEWSVDDIKDEVDMMYDGGFEESPEPDTEDSEEDTTGTGAFGGALAGGALGASVGGPAGAIGGAFLGLILGDEFEKESMKEEKKKNIKKEVVDLLLKKRIIQPDSISFVEVNNILRDVDPELLQKILIEMSENEAAPVVILQDQIGSNTENFQCSLTNVERARSYLRNPSE